jgi:hypothetical protein
MGVAARSLLVMPVVDATRQVVGVMEAVNRAGAPRFTAEDQELLRALSSFAGLALDRWMVRRPGEFWKSEVELVSTIAAGELSSTNVPDRLRLLPALAAVVGSLAFDAVQFAKNDQARILMHFFAEFGLFAEFQISIGKFLAFVAAVQAEYHNIPYHNWNHALEVAQFLFFQIKTAALGDAFSRLELLAAFVAAVCCDMGHAGRGPGPKSPFSLLFKDQPVAEVFNCSAAVRTLARPQCNILAACDEAQQREFWGMVVACILATDASGWAPVASEVRKRTGDVGPLDLAVQGNRSAFLKLMIVVADLAILWRPFEITNSWSAIISEQALTDGGTSFDSPVSAQDAVIVARRQIAFAKVQGTPLAAVLVKAKPELEPVRTQFQLNVKKWSDFVEKGKASGTGVF